MDTCTRVRWLPPVVSIHSVACSHNLTPACAAYDATQVTLVFIANKASHKFDEIENDAHVNVSFYDEKTTHWASYSGIARVSQDKALIDKHWSSMCVPLPFVLARTDICL